MNVYVRAACQARLCTQQKMQERKKKFNSISITRNTNVSARKRVPFHSICILKAGRQLFVGA